MELNWSTFALEIVNFLVLVWILKRFFYKPVLDVIAKRRAGIEKTLGDASALRAEAKTLQDRYESRLADWAAEKRQAQDALAREVDAERTKQLGQLQVALDDEREKSRVADARRMADLEAQAEHTALTQGARFATRLLQQAATPELHAKLVDIVIGELSTVSAEGLRALQENRAEKAVEVSVTSALPLDAGQESRLREALLHTMRSDVRVVFDENPALVAGLRITIGAWVLGLNMQDELAGFASLAAQDGAAGA